MAAVIFAIGLALPLLAVTIFGDERDATSEGSLALAPRPQVEPLAPLDNETLETIDLLAGEVPEGANPTETLVRNEGPATAEETPAGSIMGGLGVNRGLTQEAIENLPADVTLSFAAHSIGLQDWVDAARADGHEVLIEIPMESAAFDPTEPGADKALRITVPPAENGRRLDWMMARAQGYLNGLSQVAKSGSHPVGVGFGYGETISEVQAWIATLDEQNLQLAPATAALK